MYEIVSKALVEAMVSDEVMLVRIWEEVEQRLEEAGRTSPRFRDQERVAVADKEELEAGNYCCRMLATEPYCTLYRHRTRSLKISLSLLAVMTWGCLAGYSYKGLPPKEKSRLTLRARQRL